MSVEVCNQDSAEDTDDTFSDIDGEDQHITVQVVDDREVSCSSNPVESDEFDFSERPKRLRLKPSKTQQNAEKKVHKISLYSFDANDLSNAFLISPHIQISSHIPSSAKRIFWKIKIWKITKMEWPSKVMYWRNI